MAMKRLGGGALRRLPAARCCGIAPPLTPTPTAHHACRWFAGGGDGAVFDRALKRRQRDAAAAREDAEEYEYLRTEVARRVVDRIEDISNRDFPLMLDVGCHTGQVYRAVVAQEALGDGGGGGVGGVTTVVQGDSSERCALVARDRAESDPNGGRAVAHTIMMDEEHLPFPDGTFDLVTSSLSLHWVNDLPKAFREIRRVLKPDGAFIGAMLGGHTLEELRQAMAIGEMEREGGVSPHVSPMASASDLGGLLTAAGFALPTVDVDKIQVQYGDAFMLMEELQGMGEANAAVRRRSPSVARRDTLLAAAAAYQQMAAAESLGLEPDDPAVSATSSAMALAGGPKAARAAALSEPGGGLATSPVTATFQVLYMIGWSPDQQAQQQPDKRGSATRNLSEIAITSSSASSASAGPFGSSSAEEGAEATLEK